MKDACGHVPCSNPFSTRFVRPGAISFLFEPGESAQELAHRLAANGWKGQIVGPHGSGKSTLLATLGGPLVDAGRRPWTVGLHDGAGRMPFDWKDQAHRATANLVVIDGYEQLSRPSRFFVKAHCRRRDWGLLVTSHRDVGFPTLCTTTPSLRNAQAIVLRLLADANQHEPISPRAVAECFAACRGNVRETLFSLYDRWESARR